MKTKRFAFGLIAIGSFMLLSCKSDTTSTDKTGTFEVRMVDQPALYSSVFVDIQQVEINRSGAATESGWIVLNETPIRVDLLTLVNGVDTLLGSAELTPGTYEQLRLILGSENEIVVDGTTFPLTVPSGEQTGLKLSINAEIEAGITYRLLIDFDASKSVIRTGGPAGPGNYMLKPVIRAISEATSGKITGTLLPAEAASLVQAFNNTDTLSTYADTLTGGYLIPGVPAGTYSVLFSSRAQAFRDTTITGVDVNAGGKTDLGEISLPAN